MEKKEQEWLHIIAMKVLAHIQNKDYGMAEIRAKILSDDLRRADMRITIDDKGKISQATWDGFTGR